MQTPIQTPDEKFNHYLFGIAFLVMIVIFFFVVMLGSAISTGSPAISTEQATFDRLLAGDENVKVLELRAILAAGVQPYVENWCQRNGVTNDTEAGKEKVNEIYAVIQSMTVKIDHPVQPITAESPEDEAAAK